MLMTSNQEACITNLHKFIYKILARFSTGIIVSWPLLLQAPSFTKLKKLPIHFIQETRANSTQNRAMQNLPVSAVTTALWNSPPLAV